MDLEDNEWLSFKKLLENLQIEVPEDLYSKLDKDFTLFVYAQTTGRRIGFVIEIKEEEGLQDILTSWENRMEEDFNDLYILMNKEGPALNTDFKSANYEGAVFRYQTFSKEDLGICYAISKELFIFTSSYESMVKVISKINE